MRHAAWLPLVLILAACGDDEPAPADPHLPYLPRVAAIWEGQIPPGPRAEITVLSNGASLLDGEAFTDLADLQERLAALTAEDESRTSGGASLLPVVIAADERVSWGCVSQAMHAGAHPQVQIYRYLFRVRRAGDDITGLLPWILPRWSNFAEERRSLRLRLYRRQRGTPDAYTLIKFGRDAEFALPNRRSGAAERRAGVLASLRIALEKALDGFGEGRRNASADIVTPPPKGPHVPFGDVAVVLGLLLELGIYPELPAAEVEADLGYCADGSLVDDDDDDSMRFTSPTNGPPVTDPRDMDLFGRVAVRAKEEPTEEGLRWLAAHQAPDGGFPAADFGAWCDLKTNEGERPDGAGDADYDVGAAGLAISAFLAAGYTNRGKHAYKRTISRGLRHLKNVQDPEGCFGERRSASWIYNHAAASLAMVEAYGMTLSPIFKGASQRAISFSERCRNPGAVWRYGIRPGDNDTSVTGWMCLPLASARLINEARLRESRPPPFQLGDAPFEAVTKWLDRVTGEQGHVGYITRSSRASRTPAQMKAWPRDKTASLETLCLHMRFLLETAADDPTLAQTVARMIERPPAWRSDGSIDMAYWRFGALVAVQLDTEAAKEWQAALRAAVLAGQRQDGTSCTYKGSWDPAGPWGADGGRVYSTAMMVLCLEAERAYMRGFGR